MPLPTPPSRIPVVLWQHPECRESRRVEALLASLLVDLTRVSLAEGSPGRAALEEALGKLGTTPHALARHDSPLFAELGLAEADDEALVAAMVRHPDLIQRPLVMVAGPRSGTSAVIARPAELALRLIAPPAPADGGRAAIRRLLQGER